MKTRVEYKGDKVCPNCGKHRLRKRTRYDGSKYLECGHCGRQEKILKE